MPNLSYQINPIGILRSPFKEKFGIPRQPGLINSVSAYVDLITPYNIPDSVRGLDRFSHIWLSFKFHKNNADWKPLVRPPRLGGNKKVGVFASRSSFRPNSLGLSVVELRAITNNNKQVSLEIACPDMINGTPIYDIKPYIAYADSIPDAASGFASTPPLKKFQVNFNHRSLHKLTLLDIEFGVALKSLIIESLEYDPRPAYKKAGDSKQYGITLYDFNIVWVVSGCLIEVIDIEKMN